MMVGVPVLFMVWVGVCWPFTCVMGVGVGVSGWCCFQYCVAVVLASRRVPGVGVGVCVLVCLGVGWLVPGVSGAKACVVGLVCVSWFRMLMRVPLSVFFVLLSWFCLFVLLMTLFGRVGLVWCGVRGVLFGVAWSCVGRVLGLCGYWVVVLVVGESVCLWALVCL